jgi:hypothetical protein
MCYLSFPFLSFISYLDLFCFFETQKAALGSGIANGEGYKGWRLLARLNKGEGRFFGFLDSLLW